MGKLDKVAIKTVMANHLKKIGYPNITNERIMQELPELFKVLDRENLIPEPMTYQMFYQIALVKYQQEKLRRAV